MTSRNVGFHFYFRQKKKPKHKHELTLPFQTDASTTPSLPGPELSRSAYVRTRVRGMRKAYTSATTSNIQPRNLQPKWDL